MGQNKRGARIYKGSRNKTISLEYLTKSRLRSGTGIDARTHETSTIAGGNIIEFNDTRDLIYTKE